MTPCQSFLFSENGLLILKQLVLITFFIQKYLYLLSHHCLILVSVKMIEILQTTQLEIYLKSQKRLQDIATTELFPFDLVLVHFLFWLYTFHMTACGSFLFRKRDR